MVTQNILGEVGGQGLSSTVVGMEDDVGSVEETLSMSSTIIHVLTFSSGLKYLCLCT